MINQTLEEPSILFNSISVSMFSTPLGREIKLEAKRLTTHVTVVSSKYAAGVSTSFKIKEKKKKKKKESPIRQKEKAQAIFI